MAAISEYDLLDEEVKELLQNYKHKKPTIYEPCTINNYKELLIGLMEEFGLLNINFIFNPHIDLDEDKLSIEALVRLINSVWTLLHYHKNCKQKADTLSEQNYIIESTNKQLNGTINRLKEKLNLEKNESRACIASAQRVSDHSNDMYQNLNEARAKIVQLTKQKETTEKGLLNKIAKLKNENEKLMDKLRNKSGTYVSCTDVCESSIVTLRERSRKQKAVINQLQSNNAELLREVLAMKEELILNGIKEVKLNKKNKEK